MNTDASTLLEAATKNVTLKGSFSPAEVGAKVGLDKFRAAAAARWLSNAGVLELGYEGAAQFSPEYRKAKAVVSKGASGKGAKKARK